LPDNPIGQQSQEIGTSNSISPKKQIPKSNPGAGTRAQPESQALLIKLFGTVFRSLGSGILIVWKNYFEILVKNT